ncbi:uncharacterized protein LOC115566055 [Sparus aurata]|uniref:uncharacterized protein LOC115566055 n=1 Tax=Sparus aurata TaxID=8175 RepID=UPI0011C1A4EC|nr:uncharacterized protein LOC115566055 [Sparus aurata]
MNCSHTKGNGYYQMYWYRQLPGETMEQIVFTMTNSNPVFEPTFSEEKFSVTKPDAETGSFTVKKVEPGDKGLYFCSVSQHRGPRGPQMYRVTLIKCHISDYKTLPPASLCLCKFTGSYVFDSDFLNMDITKHGLFSLLLFLLWTNGLTDGSDVNQTDILWKEKGDSATMNCSHTKTVDYSQMYWYRQLPGETMELIVFTAIGQENPDFGSFSEEKFSATKPDTYTGTFTVKNLEPGDKGLYLCAVSKHSDTDT